MASEKVVPNVHRSVQRMKGAVTGIVGSFVDRYKKEWDKNPVCTLFLTLLSISLIAFVVSAIFTDMESVRNILFYDRRDTFMDYFNSIMHVSDDPYSNWNSIYPALGLLFYTIISGITVPFVDSGLSGADLSFALRASQMGILSFLILTLLTVFAMHLVIRKMTKDKEIRTEPLFLLTLLSFPVLFAIERGNSILMIVVLCLAFLLGYRSENKAVRYASYIALGCAAGFKLTPAIFLLLMLREKRYKESMICVLIVAALVFLPSLLIEDGNAISFIVNILSNTDSHNLIPLVNIHQMTFVVLNDFLNFSQNVATIVGYTVTVSFIALSAVVVFLDKSMKYWKVIALLSCCLIVGLGAPAEYLTVYILIPIVFFLISEKEMTRNNLLFIMIFAMVMALIPGFDIGVSEPRHLLASLRTVLVFAAATVIISEGIRNILRIRHENRDKTSTEDENSTAF